MQEDTKLEQATNISSLDEELKRLRELLPSACIEACTRALVHLVIVKTVYRKLRLRFLIPEAYPNEAILIELTSDTLPTQVLKKMIKQADKQADECSAKGEYHMLHILSTIRAEVEDNLFLCAFDEIRHIQRVYAQQYPDRVKLNQRKGTIRLDLRSESYFYEVTLSVGEKYPEEGIQVTPGASNFPQKFVFMHTEQAKEIVRRCVLGYSAEQALILSNPMTQPPKTSSGNEAKVRLTSKNLNNLKSDVKFLKKASDLREVNNKTAANSTATRKAARRELKSLSKDEMAKEERLALEQKMVEETELVAMLNKPLGNPCKSVKAVFDFLFSNFVVRLTTEVCQACQEKVLPADPKITEERISQKSELRPERVFCGHWYHWSCLNTWMTTPPFGRDCPSCKRQLYHSDWPSDKKQLERAWANEQTKKRELEEVTDCFDLSDEFAVKIAVNE